MNSATQSKNTLNPNLSQERNLALLKNYMGEKFLAAMLDPMTTELMLNPDGQLWQEKAGCPMVVIDQISAVNGRGVIEQVANYHRKVVHETLPLLEAEFPIGEYRFAGQLPPIVKGPAFTIRKPASQIKTLESYLDEGVMTQSQYDCLINALKQRRTIFISGGTASGKTTLLNACIQKVNLFFPNERVASIEDTLEIKCTVPNYLQLRTLGGVVTMTDLLVTALRVRPDRILIGEVRGAEALVLLMSLNTGHEGTMATLHANSPVQALSRFATLVGMAKEAPRNIHELIGEGVDVVVQIARTSEGRRVQGIVEVQGWENGKFITKSIV